MKPMRFVEGQGDREGDVRFVSPGDVEVGEGHGTPLGLALPNDVDVETIAADLARFAVIALSFPTWTDGRAYSQARLLRARFGFAGEIRATGEVVADMLPLLVRTGFDAVRLRGGESRATAEHALAFFPEGHYQGDVNEHQPRFARATR